MTQEGMGGAISFSDPDLEPIIRVFFSFYFFFFFKFLAVLGLCCCRQAFSSCGERGPLFIVVCGLLIAVDSLVVEYGL